MRTHKSAPKPLPVNLLPLQEHLQTPPHQAEAVQPLTGLAFPTWVASSQRSSRTAGKRLLSIFRTLAPAGEHTGCSGSDLRSWIVPATAGAWPKTWSASPGQVYGGPAEQPIRQGKWLPLQGYGPAGRMKSSVQFRLDWSRARQLALRWSTKNVQHMTVAVQQQAAYLLQNAVPALPGDG